MLVQAIRPYAYNNLKIKNNPVNKPSAPIETLPGNIDLAMFKNVSFAGNTANWTKNTLGGYDEQLKDLQNILIDPIKERNAAAAPIVVIYSPDKDVSKLVKESIEKAIAPYAKEIHANVNDNASFEQTLSKWLPQGRVRYLSTGKKTVLMFDNIEKHINTSEKDIEKIKKDFNDVFSEKDFDNIRKLGNNSKNVEMLKSVADYCSKIPGRTGDANAATTIISISDNPQIIDPELLHRLEKVYKIVFPPLYGEAFAKMLKDEVQKQDNFIQNIKSLPNKEIEKIDMPYKSWKNLQKIKNSQEKNTLNLNYEKIPYDVIAEFCSPDNKYGAFLAKQIPGIVQQATYKYLENPEKEFLQYLLRELKTTNRLLTPENLDKETKIKNLLEFKRKSNIIKDHEQLDKMLKKYNARLISQKTITPIVSKIIDSEIESIKNGSTPTDEFAQLKNKAVLDKLKSEYIISRIDQLSENRYKFSYQDGKDDYIDLYLGSFGWGKETLWVDSTEPEKVELTRHFIKEIKSLDEFKQVKTIEFPTDREPENKLYKPTGRITIDKKPIYYIDLEAENEN
ncbi:MAG: hypothetical protein NC191_07110 [Muribaculaceae bacterium]|nr:hypothetical protein [Muribaculaceae bacterium]